MSNSSNESNDSKDQHLENELTKIKMGLESGAVFYNSPEHKLSAKVEKEWLDYIQAFDKAMEENPRPTTVAAFCGNPNIKKLGELTDATFADAEAALAKILKENSISVSAICDVDDKEMYRFITEELFAEEMDDLRVPGMNHNFIYEEFHPNHKYDIEEDCRNFISQVITNNPLEKFYFLIFSDRISMDTHLLSENELLIKLQAIKAMYDDMLITQLRLTQIDIEGEKATARFQLEWTGISGKDQLNFSDEAAFKLENKSGYWFIEGFGVPGLAF